MSTSEGSALDLQWYFTYLVCDLWLCSCVRKMICVDKSYPCFLTSSASIHGDHQCLVDFYSQFSLSALTVDIFKSITQCKSIFLNWHSPFAFICNWIRELNSRSLKTYLFAVLRLRIIFCSWSDNIFLFSPFLCDQSTTKEKVTLAHETNIRYHCRARKTI